MARTARQDNVRELQRTLFRAAKADPGRRFHALHDKVVRSDVLERAWGQVRRNRGAAGIDQTTITDVEQYGISRLLDELAADLRDGSYRPLAARRVFIPKPGTGERRPLSIPAVRDRIVQAAARIVLEPIFEAGFQPCSFGFRPRRAAHDALQVLVDEAWQGRRWVVETDIADCFEAIPHDRLMHAIEERVCDRHVLKLLRALLRAGVMHDGAVRRSVTGTPQGGVISPLLANVYLDRLDRAWQAHGDGVLVRYADDLVVMCRTEREAERALGALRSILAELGLQPKQAKTRIVHLREGGEGIDFLGFEHRWVRGREARHRHLAFLVRWPSRRTMQHARDRLRQLTARERLLLPVEQITQEINVFLRGWAGYFRYGNSARQFDQITRHAFDRLAIFVAKRHGRPAAWGRWKLPVPRARRADHPDRNRPRATPQPAVAARAECHPVNRRRRAVCGRTARTDRWGAGGNQRQSASPRSARRLPPTRHNLRTPIRLRHTAPALRTDAGARNPRRRTAARHDERKRHLDPTHGTRAKAQLRRLPARHRREVEHHR